MIERNTNTNTNTNNNEKNGEMKKYDRGQRFHGDKAEAHIVEEETPFIF